jgi:serine/threonine protein kinase
MQLCEDTLQGWIESRTSVDRVACLSIFRQICKGLEYIHGEGIIHRDLKPSNIFLLSKDQIRESDRKEIESPRSTSEAKWVVIGDFGLAVYRQGQDPSAGTISLSSSVELSQSSSTEHTSGVGTMVYASPEQIHEQSYDEKTDIYSLGIIFFELLCFMSTKMERAHLLGNLRKNILPPDFLKNYPKESAFILWLMAPSPEDRPTAAQVLKHEIFRSESLSISRTTYDRMQDRLKQQDLIIEQQRRQIEELQQKLAMAQKP